MAYNEQYRDEPQIAFEGMVADQTPATIVSRNAEEAIGFGKAVKLGAKDKSILKVASGDTAVAGITVRSQATNPENPNEYGQGENAAVLLTGAIWVKAAAAVDQGDPVFVTVATGAFGKTGDVEMAGASFETSATADNLVRVRIV